MNTTRKIGQFGFDLGNAFYGVDYVCFKLNNPYQYGMNTQEKDVEISENVYTAQFWEYDSRIGRRWNLDPKPVTGISDYACFTNNPILYSDPNGDYSRVGAWWRSVRDGEKGKIEKGENGEWGYQTSSTTKEYNPYNNRIEDVFSVDFKDGSQRSSYEQEHPIANFFEGGLNKAQGQTLLQMEGNDNGVCPPEQGAMIAGATITICTAGATFAIGSATVGGLTVLETGINIASITNALDNFSANKDGKTLSQRATNNSPAVNGLKTFIDLSSLTSNSYSIISTMAKAKAVVSTPTVVNASVSAVNDSYSVQGDCKTLDNEQQKK